MHEKRRPGRGVGLPSDPSATGFSNFSKTFISRGVSGRPSHGLPRFSSRENFKLICCVMIWKRAWQAIRAIRQRSDCTRLLPHITIGSVCWWHTRAENVQCHDVYRVCSVQQCQRARLCDERGHDSMTLSVGSRISRNGPRARRSCCKCAARKQATPRR